MKEEKNSTKKWGFWFSLAVAIIIVFNILSNFSQVTNWITNLLLILMPFIAGILIAYLLYLPCRSIETLYKKGNPKKFVYKHARTLSITTVYIMATIVIIILINVILPTVIQSFSDLIVNIPDYYNTAIEKINELPEDNILRSERVTSLIDNIVNFEWTSLLNFERIQTYIKSAMSVVSGVFDAFISIVVSIYILSQRKQIIAFLSRLTYTIFKEEVANKVKKYFTNGNQIFFKYLTSQIVDAILVGILVSVAMLILNVKYAVLLGFMIGLFNLIPYFGAIVAVAIAILITALTGGIGKALVMAIVVIILQQIDANVINPKIVGDSLNISQLLVILAVTVGGAYFGILGMFLGVPIVAVIKMILEDYMEQKAKDKEKIEENQI